MAHASRAYLHAEIGRARNHHLYAMKLSRSFLAPTALRHGGEWRRLLTPDPASPQTADSPARLAEMRSVFTGCRTQAMPLRATQRLHQQMKKRISGTIHWV